MGYTEYWTLRRDLSTDEYEDLKTDAQRILLVASHMGLSLNRDYRRPDEPDHPPEISSEHILFNGRLPDCLEAFYLPRHSEPSPSSPPFFNYCKTGRLKYTAVVQAVLIALKQIIPHDVIVSSDGLWEAEWLHGPSSYSNTPAPTGGQIEFNLTRNPDEISGRTLYRNAFPDSPDPPDVFRSPLAGTPLEHQQFYLHPDITIDHRQPFQELPFGVNFHYLIQQGHGIPDPVCLLCGRTTHWRVTGFSDHHSDHLCKGCYRNRLMKGVILGYIPLAQSHQLVPASN